MFTLEQLKIPLRALRDGTLLKFLRHNFEKDPLSGVEYSPAEAVVIWTCDLLGCEQPVNLEAIWLFVTQELRDDILNIVNANETTFPGKLFVQLVIANNRYVTVTGKNKWIDVKTWEDLPAIPSPILKSVSYSLTTMYLRNLEEIRLYEQRQLSGNPEDNTPGS